MEDYTPRAIGVPHDCSPIWSNFITKLCSVRLEKGSSGSKLRLVRRLSRQFRTASMWDDCLMSVKSRNEAIAVATELRDLLATRGFRLRKWVSNDHEVLNSIPCSERASSIMDLALDNLAVGAYTWCTVGCRKR